MWMKRGKHGQGDDHIRRDDAISSHSLSVIFFSAKTSKLCQSPPAPYSPLPQGMSLHTHVSNMCCRIVFGRFISTHTHGQEAESRLEGEIQSTQPTQATIRSMYAKPPLIPSEASNHQKSHDSNQREDAKASKSGSSAE